MNRVYIKQPYTLYVYLDSLMNDTLNLEGITCNRWKVIIGDIIETVSKMQKFYANMENKMLNVSLKVKG